MNRKSVFLIRITDEGDCSYVIARSKKKAILFANKKAKQMVRAADYIFLSSSIPDRRLKVEDFFEETCDPLHGEYRDDSGENSIRIQEVTLI